MKQLLATILLACGALVFSTASAAAAADTRPNILLVVVDDLRWDDFGAAEHPFARTPHLDRLAREGAQFRNFFCATPLCSPSRANILTGLESRHHGMILLNPRRVRRFGHLHESHILPPQQRVQVWAR
ncbi:MAG: sulfatase [Acidimicrobiia bacterium]